MVAARDGAENRRPEQNGLRLGRQDDAAAAGVGVLAQEDLVLGVAPARQHRVDAQAVRAQHVHDVARAVRDGLHGRKVHEREGVHRVDELEAREDPAQRGVGPGRSVAVEVGRHVQVARERGGERRAGRERGEALVEERVDARAPRGCLRRELGAAGR